MPTKQIPADFFFRIEFNKDHIYDSSDSTLNRSYNAHDTTLKLNMTSEEVLEIYYEMLKNNFFNLPQEIPLTVAPVGPAEEIVRITTFTGIKEKAKLKNHVMFNRLWTQLDTNLAKNFNNVHDLIVKILTQKDTYKKLRPSDIYYQ